MNTELERAGRGLLATLVVAILLAAAVVWLIYRL